MDAQDLHIWLADDASSFASLRTLHPSQILSQKEIARCAAFYHADNRQRAQVARLMVRQLFSHYHPDISPSQWQFTVGRYGKPAIRNPLARPLHFSLSHCKGMVALAICREPLVGVDVENHHALADVSAVMPAALTADEQAYVSAQESQQRARFYAIWTMKEAWLKATGDGLTQPLAALNVAVSEGGECRVTAAPGIAPAHFRPHCQQWPLASRWTLSLAVNLPQPRIQFYHWQGDGRAHTCPAWMSEEIDTHVEASGAALVDLSKG